jgi:chromosome segregation ATPase
MDPVRDKKSTTYWRGGAPPAVKAVLGRWWWLTMPVVGFFLADAYVAPYVADAESSVNKIKKYEQDRLEELEAEDLSQANELFSVEAWIDTLSLPELEWSKATHDSLLAVRAGIERTFPTLDEGIANLQGHLESLREPLAVAEQTKQETEREIAGLRVSNQSLRDSISVLEQQQASLQDRLYRLENPHEFDRTRALVSPGRDYK